MQCSTQDVRSAWFNEEKMVASLFVSASLLKCRSTGKCLYRCSLSRFPKDPKLLCQNVFFFFFSDKTELFYTSVLKYLGFALFLSHAPNLLTVFNTVVSVLKLPLLIPRGFLEYNVYVCL